MRVLGLDLGTKRIGIAISDESGLLAQGKGFIERKVDKETINEIVEINKLKPDIKGLKSIHEAKKLFKNSKIIMSNKNWDDRCSIINHEYYQYKYKKAHFLLLNYMKTLKNYVPRR